MRDNCAAHMSWALSTNTLPCCCADCDTLSVGDLDSLATMQFVSRVNEAMGLQLPSSLVFDYPSLPAMARHIHSQLQNTPAVISRPESKSVPSVRDLELLLRDAASDILGVHGA